MAETNAQTPSPLEQIMQMNFSFAPSCVRRAALRLGVFSHLAAGAGTAAEVARAAEASERGTRMLLDALAGFGLLTKSGDRYELTPHARQYLVRESPDYAGGLAESGGMIEAWVHPEEGAPPGRAAPPRR